MAERCSTDEDQETDISKGDARYERRNAKAPGLAGELSDVELPSANMIGAGRRGAAIATAAVLVPALVTIQDKEKLADQADSLM